MMSIIEEWLNKMWYFIVHCGVVYNSLKVVEWEIQLCYHRKKTLSNMLSAKYKLQASTYGIIPLM